MKDFTWTIPAKIYLELQEMHGVSVRKEMFKMVEHEMILHFEGKEAAREYTQNHMRPQSHDSVDMRKDGVPEWLKNLKYDGLER